MPSRGTPKSKRGSKPTVEERAEKVSNIGQQGQSRADKFVAHFIRESLGLNPDEFVPRESWDESSGAQQYTKVLNRGPKKDAARILEKMAGGSPEENKDNTRLTVIFKDAATIRTLRRLMPRFDQQETELTQAWAKKGVVLTEYEDNFYKGKTYGYRGYDLKLDLMIGKGRWAHVEVKFLHQHMRETDRYTRALFTERRAIVDKADAEGRKLTPEEQAHADANAEMISRVYDLDMKNSKYGLGGLAGPEEEIRYFEEKLEDAQEKSTRRRRINNTDKEFPINTPWRWERRSCPDADLA